MVEIGSVEVEKSVGSRLVSSVASGVERGGGVRAYIDVDKARCGEEVNDRSGFGNTELDRVL
jgi:hypothetical protein